MRVLAYTMAYDGQLMATYITVSQTSLVQIPLPRMDGSLGWIEAVSEPRNMNWSARGSRRLFRVRYHKLFISKTFIQLVVAKRLGVGHHVRHP